MIGIGILASEAPSAVIAGFMHFVHCLFPILESRVLVHNNQTSATQ
jgi:hypothetical protein